MTKFKEMKFNVTNNDALGRKIEQRLIELDYRWDTRCISPNAISKRKHEYIITNELGWISIDEYGDLKHLKFSTYDDIDDRHKETEHLNLHREVNKMCEEAMGPMCDDCRHGLRFCKCDEVREEKEIKGFDKSNGKDKSCTITGRIEGKKIIVDKVEFEEEYNFTFQEVMELTEKEERKFIGEKNKGSYHYWSYDTNAKKHTLYRKDDFDIDLEIDFFFVDQMFKEYKPEPEKPKEVKLVNWVRPKYIWLCGGDQPKISTRHFKRSKSDFNLIAGKVLEWEEKQFPETYDGCE